MPALAKKVDLVVGVDPSFQVESQMEVQKGYRRTGTRDGAFFCQGFLPGRTRAEAGGAANGGILMGDLALQDDLSRGVITDVFVSQERYQALLQGSEAAFDFAFGLRARGDQMGHAQGGEGALEL